MGSGSLIPPPPPGFTIIPSVAAAPPPPPPGFTIIGSQPPTSSPGAPGVGEGGASLGERWDASAPRREGLLKSLLNTLTGVYDIANMGPRDVAPGLFPAPQRGLTDVILGREAQAPARPMTAREILQPDPSNPSAPTIVPTEQEMGGYTAGNLAQFLAPTPAGIIGRAAQTGALTAAQGGSGREIVTSAATAGLLPPVLERVAGGLGGAAVTQYQRALGATAGPMKEAAERITPELIERGVTGGLGKLAAKGAEESNAVGGQIRAAYDAATQRGVLVSTLPAKANLDKLRAKYVTTGQGGAQVVTNPTAVAKIDSLRDMLTQIGPQATPNQLWQVRMNLDEIIGPSGFGQSLGRGTAKKIEKAARAGLQDELDKADQGIAALNKEYGLWQDLEKVAGSTQRRRVSQEMPLSTLLSGAVGAGSSYAQSGDFSDAALGGLLMAGAARAGKTPYVRTNLAVGADRSADALRASQDPIARLLAALFGGAASNPQ